MTKAIDLTGQRFGMLLIIKFQRGWRNQRAWLCQCDCGGQSVVLTGSLRTGKTKSCGCRERDAKIEAAITHGQSHTPVYNRWQTMLRRCDNPKATGYKYWGGRGIKVCDEWKDFAVFHKYIQEVLGPQPTSKHSIDRRDNDGHYEPGNLRWATRSEQNRNRRPPRSVK